MKPSPALKYNGTDYLVSEDRQPDGRNRIDRFARWVRFLFELMGGL